MGRRRSATLLVHRVRADGTASRSPDALAVEEPLQIHLDGRLAATTMRSPGHDFELAAGWCHTEGLLGGVPVRGVRYCATGSAVDTEFNVVTVETGGLAPEPPPRLGTTTTSCGLCGSTALADLTRRLEPLDPSALAAFTPAVLAAVPERVRPLQELFSTTGSVHAAAAFDASGEPLVVREDVGRHNAVDKVVGRLLLDGRLPARGLGLAVSGRASFELVHKAWAAGFAVLVAVSAPTSLAVEAARAGGLGLAGFTRDGTFTLYAPERPPW